MKRISVIGAGWLGTPLCYSLAGQGYQVTASKRLTSLKEAFSERGVALHKLAFDNANLSADSEIAALFNTDCLVITLPPGFRQNGGDDYPAKISRLIALANQYQVKQVLFTSSTSVYPDREGQLVESDASAHNEKANLLLRAEKSVLDEFDGQSVVVRLGGLFGFKRHPANFAKRMKSVSDQAPANMVHIQDVISGVEFLVNHTSSLEGVFNLVAPFNLNKFEFYSIALKIAKQQSQSFGGVVLPKTSQVGKLISSEKLQALGFNFGLADAKQAIEQCILD